jgi:hypothetical protein
MKYIISTLFILSTLGLAARADQGLDDLRKSFTPNMTNYIASLDLVASLKPTEIKLGTSISKEECESIATKAKASAKIDPFEFIYESGSSEDHMCGGRWGWKQNFIQSQSGKTVFGIPYNLIVQVRSSDETEKELYYTSYFFDSSFKIVQREYLNYDYQGKLRNFVVTTKDTAGNFYNNFYERSSSYPQKPIVGFTSIQTWIPADGSSSGFILRNRITDTSDPKHNFETIVVSRTDKIDWQSYELPLTHSNFGGFFKYDDKFTHYPHNYSLLTIKSKDGKEVCSYGSITQTSQWKKYPENNDQFYTCVNF